MNNLCENFKSQLGNAFDCQVDDTLALIRTPLMYPDGDYIILYIDLSLDNTLITDMGETMRWITNYHGNSDLSIASQKKLQDICSNQCVQFLDGELYTRFDLDSDLTLNAIRIGQACLRVADLEVKIPVQQRHNFDTTTEALLARNQIVYKKNRTIAGGSGKPWKVNFSIPTSGNGFLIKTLAASDRSYANRLVNLAFATWSDIGARRSNQYRDHRFISFIDDENSVWDASDFAFLSSVCKVYTRSHASDMIEEIKND